MGPARRPSTVPTGVAVFPEEIAPPIRRFAEQSNNIVHWTEFDRGGHFAAMEEPDLLVGDVRAVLPAVPLSRQRPAQASPRHVSKWLMAKLVRARAAAER